MSESRLIDLDTACLLTSSANSLAQTVDRNYRSFRPIVKQLGSIDPTAQAAADDTNLVQIEAVPALKRGNPIMTRPTQVYPISSVY